MLKRFARMSINDSLSLYNLLNLPSDILLNIFKYLRYDEVMRLLIVNKRINNFIKENSKYIEFNSIHYNFEKNNIDNLIKQFPRIKLHVDHRKYNNYLDYINNIDELILFNSNDKLIDFKLIKSISKIDISMSNNIINFDSLKDNDCKVIHLKCCYNIISDLSPFINIKTIELYSNNNITDISPLKNRTYEKIDLSLCINLKDISPLRTCNIKKLILSCTPIEDVSSIGHINNIRLVGCHNIKDFSPLSNVEILNISDTFINDVSCLKNNRILDLSKCKNIININCLINNKRLEKLDIRNTHVSNLHFYLNCLLKK